MTSIPTILLAGNPNCGKTALFNGLTGAKQKVGNWSGVTVERKSGYFKLESQQAELIDLPGTYSLSVAPGEASLDQHIANDSLLAQDADCVINIIDGVHLERHLYLTVQLLELGIPMVIGVNMMDIVKKRGIILDLEALSKALNCPVVPLIANRKRGIKQLKAAVLQLLDTSKSCTSSPKPTDTAVQHGLYPLPQVIQQAQYSIAAQLYCKQLSERATAAMALRLLEGDRYLTNCTACPSDTTANNILGCVEQQNAIIKKHLQEDADILIADARYQFIRKQVAAIYSKKPSMRAHATQRIDRIVLNRYLGIPIFLLVMYSMFVCAINIGGAFQDFFDIGSTAIFIDGLSQLLQSWHWPTWIVALLTHGIGKGINTTLTFIPVIGGMFLFLALLEDSGYMARAAFVMDRVMRALGLPGKSFVPMIVGFGCNVPAVMGARGIGNQRDRILTVMMTPFMSCGARLAIFAVFVGSFFPHHGQNIVFLLYLLGILVAVLTGLLLRRTVLPGKPAALIIELPPYHVPQISAVLRYTWQRLSAFIWRAGRYIIPLCVVLGALNSISPQGKLLTGTAQQHSLLAHVGSSVTPVLKPMGIQAENWPATVGLITGVLAKEVVIGTLNTLYSQHAGLSSSLQPSAHAAWTTVQQGVMAALQSVPDNLQSLPTALFNPVAASEAPHDMSHGALTSMHLLFATSSAALAYLIFVLLYFPCISTMAVIRRELGHSWAWLAMGWSTLVAYSTAVSYYQLSQLLIHPLLSLIYLILCLLSLCAGCYVIRNLRPKLQLQTSIGS